MDKEQRIEKAKIEFEELLTSFSNTYAWSKIKSDSRFDCLTIRYSDYIEDEKLHLHVKVSYNKIWVYPDDVFREDAYVDLSDEKDMIIEAAYLAGKIDFFMDLDLKQGITVNDQVENVIIQNTTNNHIKLKYGLNELENVEFQIMKPMWKRKTQNTVTIKIKDKKE